MENFLRINVNPICTATIGQPADLLPVRLRLMSSVRSINADPALTSLYMGLFLGFKK
jgi:hypothetical protein